MGMYPGHPLYMVCFDSIWYVIDRKPDRQRTQRECSIQIDPLPLPGWAVSIADFGVGLSPRLAVLTVGPIDRFMRRAQFVRGQSDATSVSYRGRGLS